MAMVVVIDTREQQPLPMPDGVETMTATLATGDYSLAGAEPYLCIERKSLPDLVGSLTHGRERFLRECERMVGYHRRHLVIEAGWRDILSPYAFSSASPRAIYGSVMALSERYDIHVHACDGRVEAGRMVATICHYHAREMAHRLSNRRLRDE